MPKLNDLYPSKYLSAADLNNKEVVATIAEVTIEEFENDGKKQLKPLAHFQGTDKAFVLNKTNSVMISEIAGSDDTDNWAGAQVCLYPTMVQFGAKMTEAVRIKRPVAAAPVENQPMVLGATTAPQPDPVDSIPFGAADALNAG